MPNKEFCRRKPFRRCGASFPPKVIGLVSAAVRRLDHEGKLGDFDPRVLRYWQRSPPACER